MSASSPRPVGAGLSVPARKRRLVHVEWSLLLIVPYIIAVSVFHVGPAFLALIFSFSKFEFGRPQLLAAGFENFAKVFADPLYWQAYGNVIQFSALATLVGFVGALTIALLLALTRDQFGSAARTLLFLPGAINPAVMGLVFIFMLDPNISPFGFVFKGLGWNTTSDIANTSNAIPIMAALRFFVSSGAWIAIFYSALEGVSQELLDSGRIDGCSPWQLAWFVRRPMIMGFVWFMIIQLISYNLQIFAEPFVITTALGGASFIGPYWSPNMLGAFYTLQRGDLGMASVISLTQTMISLVASIFVITRTGAFIVSTD